MEKKPLQLDVNELRKMGLSGTCFWVIEYDLPSLIRDQHAKDPEEKYQKGYTKEDAENIQKIRNKLLYQLKFNRNIGAIRNLLSSWFINEDALEEAKKLCEEIRSELESNGLHGFVNKVRILPILTNEEGLETFEDRKAEFLLDFCMEAQKQVEKGLKIGSLYEPTLWRCDKTYEIVNALKEQLRSHKRYNEIVDTVEVLNDSIQQYKNIKEEQKIAEMKKNGAKI